MDRHGKRRWWDTALLAAAVSAPFIVAMSTGCFAPFGDAFGGLLRATAATSMPEASVQHEFETITRTSSAVMATHPEYRNDSFEIAPTPEQTEERRAPESNFVYPDTSGDVATAETIIPAENRGPIQETQYLSMGSGDSYLNYENASVRNATNYSMDELLAAIEEPLSFQIEKFSDEPQVLVVHTHSTESFDRFDAGFYDTTYPYRSTDSTLNVVAVGEVLTNELNRLGIRTVHATEYHDYPSYDNSYSRSRETILRYLEQYPSIQIVLDVHRDGIETEDGTRIKPTVTVDGHKAAQVMIVSGAGDDWDAVPEFRKNLAFAVQLQNSLATICPDLARPVYFAYRHYNQDITPGSLLIEFGSHGNTLAEAQYSAVFIAQALADLF